MYVNVFRDYKSSCGCMCVYVGIYVYIYIIDAVERCKGVGVYVNVFGVYVNVFRKK